jgi:tripartite-type tricarboxylate transporter receptor subunit TctC
MTLPRRRFLHLAIAAALPTASKGATAEAYPSRPITMVVPVPAGGQMDSIARIVAEHMRTRLSQPIIVDNATGASGRTIGVARVARAATDGYTLLYGAWATQVVNGAVYSLQYDLINDFEPIALTSITPWLIAAKHAVLANDLRALSIG